MDFPRDPYLLLFHSLKIANRFWNLVIRVCVEQLSWDVWRRNSIHRLTQSSPVHFACLEMWFWIYPLAPLHAFRVSWVTNVFGVLLSVAWLPWRKCFLAQLFFLTRAINQFRPVAYSSPSHLRMEKNRDFIIFPLQELYVFVVPVAAFFLAWPDHMKSGSVKRSEGILYNHTMGWEIRSYLPALYQCHLSHRDYQKISR